jgi:hypothetical protein
MEIALFRLRFNIRFPIRCCTAFGGGFGIEHFFFVFLSDVSIDDRDDVVMESTDEQI